MPMWRKNETKQEIISEKSPSDDAISETPHSTPEQTASSRIRLNIETQIARIDSQMETAKNAGADHLLETLTTQRAEWAAKLD